MGSIRMQLVLYGLAVVSGSVIKPFSYQLPFEMFGHPKVTPIRKEFPSIGTPYLIPIPTYYTSESRKDCDHLTEVPTTRPHQVGVFAVEEEKTPTNPPTIDVIPEPPTLGPISIPVLPQFNFPDAPSLPVFVEGTRPVNTPETLYLPPLSLPELPAREIVGEQGPIFIPENPALPTFSEENTSVLISEAPVLPPFFLPKLPTRISVEQLASKPGFVICFHIDGKKIELIRPTIIPEAPVVPPFPLPELPVRIEEPSIIISDVPLPSKPEPLVIPKAPFLPPLSLSEVPVGVNVEEPEPIFISEVPALPTFVGEQQLIVIPKAPVLPPFSRPEFPLAVISKDPAPFWSPYPPSTLVADEPAHSTFEVENKPFVIPEAPVLPPQFIPIFPISVVPEEPKPDFNAERPDLPTFTHEKTPDSIPKAPVLPPLSLPELPVSVIAGPAIPELPAFINEVKPLVIPQAPELPPLELFEIPRVVVQEPIQAPVLPPRFFPETPQHVVNAEPAPLFFGPASSPIVVEAPVQIVVQGSRFIPADCDTLCKNLPS